MDKYITISIDIILCKDAMHTETWNLLRHKYFNPRGGGNLGHAPQSAGLRAYNTLYLAI